MSQKASVTEGNRHRGQEPQRASVTVGKCNSRRVRELAAYGDRPCLTFMIIDAWDTLVASFPADGG